MEGTLLSRLRAGVSVLILTCQGYDDGDIGQREMSTVEDRFNAVYRAACSLYGSSSKEITDIVSALYPLYGTL